MKIFEINGGVFGSTGRIMFGIAKRAKECGNEVVCASPITSTNRFFQPNNEYIKIGSFFSRRLSVVLSRLTGLNGCFSLLETITLLKKIKIFNPDIIHLHNLHDSFVNIPILFSFIKKHNVAVVWTLHDCWPFTGHCPYFSIVKCDKWKQGCFSCPNVREYPKSIIDNSSYMWKKRKNGFWELKD